MFNRSVQPMSGSISDAVFLAFVFLAMSTAFFPGKVRAEITTNIDERVSVEFTRTHYDRHSRAFNTWVTVTNTSSAEIMPPIRVAITGIYKNKYEVINADGINSGGVPYIELDVDGGILAVGQTTNPALLSFGKVKKHHKKVKHNKKTKYDEDDWDDDKYDKHGKSDTKNKNEKQYSGKSGHKSKSSRFKHHKRWEQHSPPVKFNYAAFGGTSIAVSSPTSLPFALIPNSGDTEVLFRVRLLTDGSQAPGNIRLRNLDSGVEALMNDDGHSGDTVAGDGIYAVQQTLATAGLNGGDCQPYVGVATSVQGFDILSTEYQLCATNFTQQLAQSDTSAGNQVQIGDATVVGNELLVVIEPGFSDDYIKTLLGRFGGEVVGTSLLTGLYQVRFPQVLSPAQIDQLSRQIGASDGVSGVSANYFGEYNTTPNDTQYALQHGLQLISSDDLSAGTPSHVWDANAVGAGMTVTLLDSGVDAGHPDLSGKVLAEVIAGANSDSLGHGTEMAGIIAAATDNALGIAAPGRSINIESFVVSVDAVVTQAEMIAGLNNVNASGTGSVLLAAFSVPSQPVPANGLCGAIDNIISSGVVVVNSAGNTNTDINTWPGLCNDPALDPFHPDDISTVNKESFIVVAASDCSAGNCAADAKKADSNFGSWIELAAPGVNIQSTTIASVDASLYTLSNGTSAAAAFTTAGAAILISCGVTPDQVLNSLDLGATVAVTGDFNRINLYDSLAALNSLPTGLGLSVSTVNENTSGNTTVGNLSTTDTTNCDSHSYSITGGADAANFSIGAGGSSLVINDGTLNFESKSSYAVTVQSTDFYGASTSQAFIVNVVDLDEPPSILPQLRNIDENSANGTNVGAPIVASDQDAGASLAFAITAGNTGGAFVINNAGQITVANSAALDFETTPVFNLTVEVTDNGDVPPLSNSAAITVNLNDLAEGGAVFSIDFNTRQNGTAYTSPSESFPSNEYNGVEISDSDITPGSTFVNPVNPSNSGTVISGYYANIGAFDTVPITQVTLDFTNDVSSLSFDYATPSGNVTVLVFDGGGLPIGAPLLFSGSAPFINQAGFTVNSGSAAIGSIGDIGSIVIQADLDQAMILDNLNFTTVGP